MAGKHLRDFRGALACALLLVASTSCASLGAAPASRCTPQFPYAEGWLGADAAYSIPLSDGRSVWLFGDTFVGEPGQRTRNGSSFIHNSVAVSECGRDGRWLIDYAWGETDDGKPQSFFHSDDQRGYWWLFDGFEHAGSLYVGLLGVEESEPRGPLNLPFRLSGMKLARIANYREAPTRWRYEILPLSDNRLAFPGSAMVIHDQHLYLFAFLDRDAEHYPRMLARLPLAALAEENPGESMEYLAADQQWRHGFEPDLAHIVMNDNASEMSVRFHEEFGVWLAVYNYPDLTASFPTVPPSGEIRLRTAKQVEGPWSEPRTIFLIPELAGDFPSGSDPNTFCYAAKEHPQYSRDGQLLVTYVCNLFTASGEDPWTVLSRLLEKMYLYRPQVVSIPMPDLKLD